MYSVHTLKIEQINNTPILVLIGANTWSSSERIAYRWNIPASSYGWKIEKHMYMRTHTHKHCTPSIHARMHAHTDIEPKYFVL